MQIYAILCLCLVNFVFESNAKTAPLNMQVPIVADFRMTNLKEYIDNKISKELKKASETESKVEKLEDILSSLRTKFKNMSEIQDTFTKQIEGINGTASETESKVEKLEDILSSLRTKFKNMSEIQDTFTKQIEGINGTDIVKSMTDEIRIIKIIQEKNIKNIAKILNNVDNSSNELKVKLFVLTQRHGSSMDSYIALPKRYLGTDYLIPSYTQSTTVGPGTYLGIVSSKPKSQVEIFGKDKRSKLYRKITMDKEKSWQDYNNDRIDISGTYVKATTPVAVFSNIVCVQHDNSCYPFSDMVIPMRDYSKVFLIPHIENTEKWTIRLYAKLTCNVKIFDNNRRQLSTYTVKSDKKFIEMHLKAMSSVVSSCASMVQLYGHKTGKSVSFMVLVPGIDKYLPYYYFMVPNYTSSLYVMIKTVHMKEIRIDGSTYSPKTYDTFLDPTNPNHKYSVFSVSVSAGRHEVKTVNDAPFGLWIYGKGFAYPAGYGVNTK